MIDRNQIPFQYIQRSPLSGSEQGMRFYLQRKEDALSVTLYPEPYCFVKTPPEQKTTREFPNTPEGLDEAIAWMNQELPSYRA